MSQSQVQLSFYSSYSGRSPLYKCVCECVCDDGCMCHCVIMSVCRGEWGVEGRGGGSGSGELGVNWRLLPVLRAALRDDGHTRVVSDGCVHGPLAGAAHIAES